MLATMGSCIARVRSAVIHLSFFEKYELGQELGRGHFATILGCTNKRTHAKCAVKVMSLRHLDLARAETAMLRRVTSHPNSAFYGRAGGRCQKSVFACQNTNKNEFWGDFLRHISLDLVAAGTNVVPTTPKPFKQCFCGRACVEKRKSICFQYSLCAFPVDLTRVEIATFAS